MGTQTLLLPKKVEAPPPDFNKSILALPLREDCGPKPLAVKKKDLKGCEKLKERLEGTQK